MQTIDRSQSHFLSRGALLAGAAVLAALAFATPETALAACGGGASTGAHPAASGGGGIHTGASPAAGSTGGGSSCGVSAAHFSVGGASTPALAGVHSGVFAGNGKRTTGSLSRTASTVTATRNVSNGGSAGVARVVGGGGHAHFFHPGKRP